MSRSAPASKTKAPRQRKTTPPTPEQRNTLHPALEAELKRLFSGFFKRMLVLFLLVGVVTTFAVAALRLPPTTGMAVQFAAAFGVILPYWRGIDRISKYIKQIGRDRVNQRRFADARYALEYFHRLGNMSLDIDGEAHYYLMLAYLGLDDLERARQMVTWLQKNRPRSKWPEKAASVFASAERAQARRQQSAQQQTEDGS